MPAGEPPGRGLSETHRFESGYFSPVDGAEGRMDIGTTEDGRNAFLAKFAPHTETQTVVIETHALCGLIEEIDVA